MPGIQDIRERVIERMKRKRIVLLVNFAPSFRMRPDRLSKPAAFETCVAFKIVRIEFSETNIKLKWQPRIICS